MTEITVHNLEQSRSFRVLWLLDELDIDYKVKQYKRNDEGLAALQKVHALAKAPVIETRQGTTIAETGFIFEYVILTYDKQHLLAPPYGSTERQAVQYWLHFSEGSLIASAVTLYRLFKAGADLTAATKHLKTYLDFVESNLNNHEWLAGSSFTAADIIIEFPVELSAVLPGITITDYPKLSAWKEKIKQRPAYQKALKANGDYNVSRLL